jgi:transketolase
VLAAADLLAESGVAASVVHVPSLKPLDTEARVKAIGGAPLVVTVEEHSILGGLGGLVTEVLTSAGPSPQVLRIGLDDVWGESAGNDFLLEKHGLSASRIAERVQGVLSRSSALEGSPA